MPTRESPRMRRLRSDHRALTQLANESSILEFTVDGNPPDFYRLTFSGNGFWRPENAADVFVQQRHIVTVKLGAAYPRLMPELAWQSPIFHPNISASGVVCLGGYGSHWVPSVGLDELVVMLWDMIRYQNYDIESPYNREAAAWARSQSSYGFPCDTRPLRDLVASGVIESGANPTAVEADVMFLNSSEEVIEAEIVEPQQTDANEDIVFID
ncbi:MAG: ubiquitin-conjugating enzyme E2 [bacterium]|nr:ubiquitin-conjugating enzyme E2 [bacterium]